MFKERNKLKMFKGRKKGSNVTFGNFKNAFLKACTTKQLKFEAKIQFEPKSVKTISSSYNIY